MLRRSLGKRVIVAVIVLLAALGLPQTMSAAGCRSVCSAVQPPGCLDCGFTAFRSVYCLRLGCDFCEEDYCTVEAFCPGPKIADEKRVDSTAHKPRVLRVETLSPRS